MALVEAYRKDTGEKLTYRVPKHFFDHPVLGRNLARTPSSRAVAKTPEPSETWTVLQLREYAEKAGVDLAGATTKADILSVLAPKEG